MAKGEAGAAMTWRPSRSAASQWRQEGPPDRGHMRGGYGCLRVGPCLWAAYVVWPIWCKKGRRKERLGIDTRGRVLGMFRLESQADICRRKRNCRKCSN